MIRFEVSERKRTEKKIPQILMAVVSVSLGGMKISFCCRNKNLLELLLAFSERKKITEKI
jgi:hypothetical protein